MRVQSWGPASTVGAILANCKLVLLLLHLHFTPSEAHLNSKGQMRVQSWEPANTIAAQELLKDQR